MSRLTGDRRLRRTLGRIEPATGERVRGAMRRAATEIEDKAVGGAPVDEGDLVRSIEKKSGRDGLTWVIGPGAKSVRISKNPWSQTKLIRGATAKERYWQFFKGYWIEFGTSKMPAQPFMQPAFDTSRDKYLRQVRAAVRKALSDASSNRLR